MEEKQEKLYLLVIQNLINNLKSKIEFTTNEIEYDNLELFIKSSNMRGINPDDFSISFQKQNGSFTLILNSTMDETKKSSIVELMETNSNVGLFATYSFSDLKDDQVFHFVYDDDKLEFNKNILDKFNELGQLESLSYSENFKNKKR